MPETASDQPTDAWITTGAGPKHANFEKLLLIPHGLLIIFDAYQVGSYAEGRREVYIPATALSGILKPNLLSALAEAR